MACRAKLRLPGGTVLTVQAVQLRGCAACGRTIYAQGAARIIEAARTGDSDQDLVAEFLSKKPWLRRRRPTVVREADVAIVFEEYARTGRLRMPRELNELDPSIGLFEIKAGPGRFPFYELADEIHPVLVTRLTHGFTKGTVETPRKELDTAKRVMNEDRKRP